MVERKDAQFGRVTAYLEATGESAFTTVLGICPMILELASA
ncbi:hypothetical protein MY1884_007540 [Beauveria asiatica]